MKWIVEKWQWISQILNINISHILTVYLKEKKCMRTLHQSEFHFLFCFWFEKKKARGTYISKILFLPQKGKRKYARQICSFSLLVDQRMTKSAKTPSSENWYFNWKAHEPICMLLNEGQVEIEMKSCIFHFGLFFEH